MASIADANKCWLRSTMRGRVELWCADAAGNWRLTVDQARDQPFMMVIDSAAMSSTPGLPAAPPLP